MLARLIKEGASVVRSDARPSACDGRSDMTFKLTLMIAVAAFGAGCSEVRSNEAPEEHANSAIEEPFYDEARRNTRPTEAVTIVPGEEEKGPALYD
jgi:uncharacterized protein YceK